MADRFYLGDQNAKLYLGSHLISSGSELITKTITSNGTYNASSDDADGYSQVIVNTPQPVVSSFSAAADLTGYSGSPDLGNGFEITNFTTGSVCEVDSETIGDVTYNGLRIGGMTTIRTKRYFGRMSTFEVEFIINSFVSGDNRLLSTGGYGYDFSIYKSSYDDYLHYVAADFKQVLDPTVYRDASSGGNCTDNSIPTASLVGAVTNIKFVDDGTYTTLYVNDVAKINWLTGYANNSFFLYGQNVGANGLGGADMLITKLQWAANGIEYDGHRYALVD